MVFPAHITQIDGDKKIQTVKQHCFKTAGYAKESLESLGLGHTAYLAGMLHDFGKAVLKYKQYVEAIYDGKKVKRGSVNHTFASVIYLFQKYGDDKNEKKRITCEIISYAAGSHHGLFDALGPDGESGFSYRVNKNKNDICYDEACKNYFETCISEEEIEGLFQKATEEVSEFIERIKNCINPERREERADANENLFFLTGLMQRFVLSAVINGDRRDTAEFFAGKEIENIDADEFLWKRQLDFLEKTACFTANTAVNKARAYISDVCAGFVADNGGVYKITVPTGAGKTISMLRFALVQAKRHKKKRIIFIIPLLSILDQNSEVIRKYIESKEIIFEHHSNVVKTEEDGEELDRYELLSETWDSPIVISTMVQFLNSLFSSKTSSVRRMQSLSESVIVIDEAQSVPKKLTYMFNMAMNFLAYCANATIVLSSATQPAFDSVKKKIKFSENADIVPYNRELWNVFERTQIICHNAEYENEEELAVYAAEVSKKENSLLVICNTKRNAAKLYDIIRGITSAEVFHLSTAMCMAHRTAVLHEVFEMLNSEKRVICVSTQLVEAGVDFSFKRVIRMEAGLDNAAQAAGRCNRHGESTKKGTVEIVKLKNENISMLREIEISQDCFRRFLADFEEGREAYENILSPQSVNRYFELLFCELKSLLAYPQKVDITDTSIFNMLAQNNDFGSKNKNYCINQAFKTAGMYFKVFDEDTYDVIVPYDDISRNLLSEISGCDSFDFNKLKKLVEKAKPYTVHMYGYQKENLESSGMIYWDKGKRIMMLNDNDNVYSADKGLSDDVANFNLII